MTSKDYECYFKYRKERSAITDVMYNSPVAGVTLVTGVGETIVQMYIDSGMLDVFDTSTVELRQSGGIISFD